MAQRDDEGRSSSPSSPIATAESRWDLLPVPELVDQFPRLREPVIDGLLRRGEVGTVIASPKLGKSWLVYGVAAAVAAGRDWLGWQTQRGRVLIVDLELHPETLAYRLGFVTGRLGLTPEETAGIEVLPLRGRSVDIHQITARADLLAGRDLLIIDALYRILPAGTSENDNSQMAAVYNAVDALARETGAAVLLVHHSSKGCREQR